LNLIMNLARRKFLVTKCALFALALLVLGGGWALPVGAQTQAAASTNAPAKASKKPAPKAAPADQVGPPIKAIGSKTAPITMEVFSDYQCPSCRMLYEQTLRQLINDYVASGKVYLIHRDFPLPIPDHRFNWDAARWVNAAAEIGKFEEVEAALYDNQVAWSSTGDIEKYVAGAMSPADFKRVQKLVAGCLTQTPGNVKPAGQNGPACPLDVYINQDIALGKQIPVQATPTYMITSKGQRLPAGSGPVSWPILKQFLDSLLTQ
jgi:protein-disulfide isomerase